MASKESRFVRIAAERGASENHIRVEPLGDGRFRVTIDDVPRELSAYPVGGGLAVNIDGRVVPLQVERRGEHLRVTTAGGRDDVHLLDARTWALRTALGEDPGAIKPEVISPMAGRIVLVKVAAGDSVERDQTLVVIEAMKMENEIRAPASGKIREVRVSAGDLVSPGHVLLAFDLDA